MDLQTKNLLNCPDVFADVVNVNLFQGRHILSSEMLEKQPTEMIYRDDKEELRHHFLDTRMKVCCNGTDVAYLCVENQAQISNAMPIRDMGYRYSNYREQIQEIKEKLKNNEGEGGAIIMKSFSDMVERDAIEKGMEKGVEKGKAELIRRMLCNHQTPKQVSAMTGETIEYIHKVEESMLQTVHEKSGYQSETK